MQSFVYVVLYFIAWISFTRFPYCVSEAEECYKRLGLPFLTRNDEAYNKSNQQFWTTGTLHRPQGFILVRNVFDVQKAIECARRNDINLAVKSGGHSFESYSFGCNNSWVIDLKHLNEVSLNSERRTVTFGSGLNTLQLENFLWKEGYIVPLGTCDTVGVSGISMGGGIGLLSRKYGLTLDQIKELEIVTADGEIHKVSKKYESDLFWALCGAGGGNFGIVTKLTLKVHKPPKFVVRIRKTYDNKYAPSIFYKWQEYFTSWKADDSVFSEFKLNYLQNKTTAVNLVIATDTETHGEHLIRKMKHIFPNITNDLIKRYDNFIDLQYEMSKEDGAPPSLLPICHKPLNFFASRRLTFKESKKATDTVINNDIRLYVATFGGRINRISQRQTAWVHRTSKYNVILSFKSKCDGSGDNDTSIFEKFRFMDNGESYQNYISKQQDNYLHRYYGLNLHKLIYVKNKYDHHNFFCFPQSIPLDLSYSRDKCSCDYQFSNF